MSNFVPKCKEPNRDCFAIKSDGRCKILERTYIHGGCPYYKPARCVNLQKEYWDCMEYARSKGESTDLTERMWGDIYGKKNRS